MGRLLIALALMLSLGLSVTGCKKDDPAGADIGGITDTVEDAADDAAEDVEEAVEGSDSE